LGELRVELGGRCGEKIHFSPPQPPPPPPPPPPRMAEGSQQVAYKDTGITEMD